MQDTLHLYLRADGATKRWAPEQPWAELSAQRGTQVSPQVSRQSRLPGFGLASRLYLIPQGSCGSGEGWAGGPGCAVDTPAGFGSGQPTLSHRPCSLPLC